jgi:hypothetical protein
MTRYRHRGRARRLDGPNHSPVFRNPAPVVPIIGIAECVAVEAGASEILQAVEVLRDELVVRDSLRAN